MDLVAVKCRGQICRRACQGLDSELRRDCSRPRTSRQAAFPKFGARMAKTNPTILTLLPAFGWRLLFDLPQFDGSCPALAKGIGRANHQSHSRHREPRSVGI